MSRFTELLTIVDLRRLKRVLTPPAFQSGVTVRHTGIYLVINAEYGVGTVNADMITLTGADCRKIRRLIKEQIGFDLVTDLVPETGTETARFINNEKQGRNRVKHKRIKLYGLQSTAINGEMFTIPDGAVLEINLSELRSIGHQQIILVENFEAFVSFRSVNCVIGGDPLVVYRGDNEVGVLGKELSELFPEVELIAWTDADPAGICLGVSTGAKTLLLPNIESADLDRYGRSELYIKQEKYLESALKSIPVKLGQAMIASGKGLTQESMIANQLPLSFVRI